MDDKMGTNQMSLPPSLYSLIHSRLPAGRHSIIVYPSRHWNRGCRSCNDLSGFGMYIAILTTDPANLAPLVVSDNNALFGWGNRIAGPATALSLAE